MPFSEKPHILIVDDNPINRELICDVAIGAGFIVKEAKNGKEAIAFIEETNFNLVMLD
ncbi:response regulator, partial [bacterium]|nr:response regulator [bacterium]